jgi:phosphoglycerate kinase
VGHPKRPVIALVGGAKIASKIDLLNNLVTRVDVLVIGGGMANTFLAARGVKVGASLCERELGPTARAIEVAATRAGCKILLPIDAVVAKEFKAHADARTISVDLVPDDAMILDIGSATVAAIATALEAAKTVVWNGPLGAFEVPPFDTGTANVARLVAMLTRAGRVKSVAGGGDTVAALNHAGAASGFSYVSTAGGAFLEWLEGKELPGVAALAA